MQRSRPDSRSKVQRDARPGPAGEFIFATCRAGSERALKAQVAVRASRMLRPAFMRPQLITWKSSRPLDAGFALDSVFARVSGISLGLFGGVAGLAEGVRGRIPDEPLLLHVFPRVTPEDGVPGEVWSRIDALRGELEAALGGVGLKVRPAARPREGDLVLDVIVGAEGEKLFAGAHRHGLGRHPLPGALPRIVLPPEAPSRSFLKMEQALVWAGLDGPRALPGKTALELGCAPGGATLALLRRGLHVVGVDTGRMDPVVFAEAGKHGGSFKQLRFAASDLDTAELPRPVHLLVSDMNVAPHIVLRMVEWVQSRVRARILVLTLKINDAEIERRIPRYLEQIEGFAPAPVRATQLAANRAEICVVAGELVHRRPERA